MSNQARYLVIGAGHGGKAMAAHLALMGFRVTLYNRTFDNIRAIKLRGGIELESFEFGPRGFGDINVVTSDITEALAEADIIMVVVPSTAHADIARACSCHLRDGQIIVLHPGRTGGSLEFAKTLRDSGCKADITLAEAETLIYAARSDGPAQSRIFSIKEAVPLAAFPSLRTQQVLDALAPAYPQYIDGGNVLHTGLNNMGAIFHPALTLLNAGRIESTGGDFQFYLDGATPSVAKMLEELDRERVTVAAALGIRARTAQEWLKMAYNATGANLYEAIHNQPGYRGIKAPATLNNRYIFEEIPMSLVPIAAFGQRYGVAVGAIDAIIRMACIVHQTDYWRRGRTLAKLGIEQLAVHELQHYVETGELQRD
ncbi:MAG: NAD/NADP octopine/nopaline dehydrogenase family protein [Anaerolineae bacterium]